MTKLPPRFSETYFRRYESHIKTICDVWPKAVDFQVAGSVTTFACRLRDAMKSLSEHKWKTTVNMEVFNLIYRSAKDKDFIVQEQPDGIVRVTDKNITSTNKPEQVTAKVTEPILQSSGTYDLTDSSLDQTDFLCSLAHRRLLNTVVLVSCNDEQASLFNSKYDILLEKQSEGRYLLT